MSLRTTVSHILFSLSSLCSSPHSLTWHFQCCHDSSCVLSTWKLKQKQSWFLFWNCRACIVFRTLSFLSNKVQHVFLFGQNFGVLQFLLSCCLFLDIWFCLGYANWGMIHQAVFWLAGIYLWWLLFYTLLMNPVIVENSFAVSFSGSPMYTLIPAESEWHPLHSIYCYPVFISCFAH